MTPAVGSPRLKAAAAAPPDRKAGEGAAAAVKQQKKQGRGEGGAEAAAGGGAGGAGKAGGGGGGGAPAVYMSPIAHPLLEGKLLRRSLKLIHLAADRERASRSSSSNIKAAEGKQQQQPGRAGTSSTWKLLRRGVHEVTKSLRRGMQGIVFFASDVFPIEIIAHLPILCEEKDVLYAYVCSKRTLGHAFRSQRPASVVMLTPNPAPAPAAAAASKKHKTGSKDAAAAGDAETAGASRDEEDEEESFDQLYAKVEKALRKVHPYF